MNVKVITLHKVTNFGSLLQTYATQTMFNKAGCKCEIIDFQPAGLSFARAIWPKEGRTVIKLIKLVPNVFCNIIQYNMTNKFIKKYVLVTKKKYKNYNQLEKSNISADIFVTGSDQVWNIQNANKSDDIKAYYLCFVKKSAKKIAYASSFGRDNLNVDEKDRVRSWLKEYNAISVREDAGLKITSDLKISNVAHVLDPTLLIPPEEWASFYKEKRPKYEYVFVYNLNRNKEIEKLSKMIAEKEKIKIVNFADTFEFISGAKNRIINNPKDFLYYIANAKYVVTDSFHGTAFSINFNKEFVTFPAPNFNSRIDSILRMVGLINTRYVETAREGIKVIESKIEWKEVNNIIEAKKEFSREFIRSAIEQ